MLARSSATSVRIESTANTELDVHVVVEVSDIETADRIVALIKGRPGIEVIVGESNSGKAVRMLTPASHSASSTSLVRRIVISAESSSSSLYGMVHDGVWARLDPSHGDFENQMIQTVERVDNGHCPILESLAADPESAVALMSALANRAERTHVVTSNPLSKTEIEILSRIARGQTSKEIAKDLVFKVQTVKNRVTAIMNKTNANSRGHAAAIAQANGWIDADLNRF